MAKNRGSGRNGNRSTGNRRIMDVRVVPDTEGNRAEKVERMLVAYKESQGQTRVVVRGTLQFGTQTTASAALFGFNILQGEDDFAALASQYATYKVSGIRFDIYDENPGNVANALFGTFHQKQASDAPQNYAEVADLPDVSGIAPGTGNIKRYWYPSGPVEESWNSTDSATSYGGLSVGLPASTAANPKYLVLYAFVVDFRARV